MDPKLRLGAAKCIRLDKIAPQTAHKSRKWDRAAQKWHHLGTSTPKLPLRSNKLQKRGELPQKYRQKTGQNHPPPPVKDTKLLQNGRKWDKAAPKKLQTASKTAPPAPKLRPTAPSCTTWDTAALQAPPAAAELRPRVGSCMWGTRPPSLGAPTPKLPLRSIKRGQNRPPKIHAVLLGAEKEEKLSTNGP